MGQHLSQTVGWILALGALLTGCSSPLPKPLQSDPAGAPAIESALKRPDAQTGKPVRWGGVIVRTDNRADSSLIEVLAKPLDGSGRPILDPQTPGRFIAEMTGFLDPLLFRAEREITVSGKLVGSLVRKIGDYPYRYPIVNVEAWHLWDPRPVYRNGPPYWTEPWYPWGYPYPCWRRHPRFHD